MTDRACIHCDDRGDCYRCSWFFQPDKVHVECGAKWRDHETKGQEFYAPYSICPVS